MPTHSAELKEQTSLKDGAKRYLLHDSMEFFKDSDNSPKQQALLVEDDDGTEALDEQLNINQDLLDQIVEEEDDEVGITFEDNPGDFDLHIISQLDLSDCDDIFFDEEQDEPNELKEEAIDTKELKEEAIDTPFWFGFEDQEQLRCINSRYCGNLKLAQEQKRCIRQPEPFVGRIRRQKVDNGDTFTTLDEVEVFQRSLLPPGSMMPLKRKLTILTIWSYDEGLPTTFVPLNHQSLHMWRDLIVRDLPASTLLCLPEYGTKEYNFFVTAEPAEVTHSPSSLHKIEKRNWYEKYIPDDLRFSPETFQEDCRGA